MKVSDPKLDDFILHTGNVQYGGSLSKWAFSKKGSVYDFSITLEGKKKIMKFNKVLELNTTLSAVSAYSEKNLLLAISRTGSVSSYNVDLNLNGVNLYLL